MRIVGPRATLPAQVELYTPRQRRRLDLRPGVTGWAQIHGRTGIPWEERIELDVWYVEHRSLRLDLKILARTPRALLGGVGERGRGPVRGLLARLAAEAGRRARAGEGAADGPGNLAEGLPPGGRGSRAPLVQLPGRDRQPARAPRPSSPRTTQGAGSSARSSRPVIRTRRTANGRSRSRASTSRSATRRSTGSTGRRRRSSGRSWATSACAAGGSAARRSGSPT